MNSREYWNKREAEALKHYTKDEQEYQRQLNGIYQNMLDSCQKEINSFYGKYAAKENITIAEAKKRISKLDIEAYERKAAKYVAEKNFSDKANEEMRLYNATMRINRLEMLKANIGLELIAGHDELDKFMAGILKGRTEDELKRQAGILGKTIQANAKKADALVNASFKNASFSDRIWMYQDALKNDLSKLLQSGLIQGKNPRVLAREVEKTFGVKTHEAERLMRTELARVQTEAQKQSFKRNGFSLYEFIVNRGCCDICAKLDGKHFSVDKMMPGLNAPPMHPNCRCSTAPWEDSDEYEAWLDYLDKGGTTEQWNAKDKAIWKSQRRHKKKVEKPIEHKTKGSSSQQKRDKILTKTEVENKARSFANEIISNNSIVRYNNGDPVLDYLLRKLGYDELPRVLGADSFEQEAQGKTRLFRGLHDDDKKTASEMVEAFKTGDFFAGRGVYGYGTYFSIHENIAEEYSDGNQANIIEAVLADDARVVTFKEIFEEFDETRIPRIAYDDLEAWQEVVRNVGSYAAVKGYDAIDLAGWEGQNHFVILNRGKLIVKE